jgi:hypothetical protein
MSVNYRDGGSNPLVIADGQGVLTYESGSTQDFLFVAERPT